MATPAPAVTKQRTNYFVDVGNSKIVYIKAVENSIKDIAGELGYTKDADGAAPSGKTVVGTSREDALLNGCFPIAVTYLKGGKTQQAILLVSPTKADTIASDLKGKKYAGHTIVRITPRRRRKFIY
jgi:hypothetical protein